MKRGMKQVFITVSTCEECPHRVPVVKITVDGGYESWCAEAKKYFNREAAIPNWCPLPDQMTDEAYNLNLVPLGND